LVLVEPQRPPPHSSLASTHTHTHTNMFAVVNTTALTVRAKAPVKARRTAVVAKASFATDATKKMMAKASKIALVAGTTIMPAFAALAEEEVTPVDLKLCVGFTIALGIAAFSTLPEPESSKHGSDH
jgi:microcystin-dependent protein